MNRIPTPSPSPISKTRLRDLRRRYHAELQALQQRLTQTLEDREHWNGALRLLQLEGHATTERDVRLVCQSIDDDIAALERDLSELQAALAGLDDELDTLQRRAASDLEHRVRAGIAAALVDHLPTHT